MAMYNFPCPDCSRKTPLPVYINFQFTSASIAKIDELEKQGKGLEYNCPHGHSGVVHTSYEELRKLALQS